MKKIDSIVPSSRTFLFRFAELLKEMFMVNPENRITVFQALESRFFNEPCRDDGTEAARIYMERRGMA